MTLQIFPPRRSLAARAFNFICGVIALLGVVAFIGAFQ